MLAASVLPVRSSLLFTLTCAQAAASIVVTVNGPPQYGSFAVDPTTGTELTSSFALATLHWSDPNLPITYQFGFVSSSGVDLVVHGRSNSSLASTTLPAGSATAQHQVTCFVQAFDSLSAAARLSSSVTVTPQVDPVQLQASILLQLTVSSGDVGATKNAISVGSAALNTVSCANAPDCAALNRAGCVSVKDTCGACLPQFVGDAGDKNFLCVNSTAMRLSGTGPATSCSIDSQCQSWERCDVTLPAPACVMRSKQCSGNCSAHGDCQFLNVNNLKSVSDCKVNNPSCEAVCSCRDGFVGQSCNSTTADILARQVVREQLIVGLAGVTTSDEVSIETVTSWSSSLSAVTQNPYEISAAAISIVNDVSLSILSSAQNLSGISYSSVSGVLDAVDAVATASSLNNVTSLQFVETISLFNDFVTSQMVQGQDVVEYLYASFRLSALRQVNSDASSLALSEPLSVDETTAAVVSSSVAVALDAGVVEEVSVNLVTTTASSYGALGASFNTNPLRVTVNRASAAASTVVTFTLMHIEAVDFTSAADAKAWSFNTTCFGGSDASLHNYTCPQSGEVLVHNCSGLTGVLTSYCPVLRPSCNVLNTSAAGSVNSNNSVCIATHFDALSTTCVCNITADTAAGSGRRLSNALAQSGVLDIATSSLYLANEFTNTFNSADDLTSVAALQRVLIVIIMFGTLWAGGILLIFGCVWRSKWMKKANLKEQSKLERKKQSAGVSRSPAAVRQYLADYVSETLPSVFSNKPLFGRLYGEIKRHHRYLLLLTASEGDSGDRERILTGAEILSVQTMLMFLLALLYDVQGPADDGSCPANVTEQTCLSRRSVFDSTQSYCHWGISNSQQQLYSCTYQQPQFSIQVMIYIGVLVALLVALISFPVDYIFDLLSAPLADEYKVSIEDNVLKRTGRRISNVARRASAVASNLATAAQNKLVATRQSMVGSVTRKIPEATEAAHALATASMSVIAANSMQVLQQRQLSRARSFYDAGGKYGTRADDGAADSESSDSDSGSEYEGSDGEHASRPAAAIKDANSDDGAGRVDNKSVDALFATLSEQVSCQRRFLKPSELDYFDAQWGMDPMGEFTTAEQSLLPCFKGRPGSHELIRKELEFVKSETSKRVEKLRIATDAHTGLEILHLFIKDLLGRNTAAARIFETKSNEDFKYTKVVTKTTKRLAMLALVCINVFFVYYALLTGYRRGLSWQRMYLAGCIIQFFVEICLFETMECMWVNCVVPFLVSDEVRGVSDELVEVVHHLCSGIRDESGHFLNAPDYLFVSTNVAKKFPHLMESILVQAYCSHIPGELSKTWQVGTIARMQHHQRGRRTTVLAVVLGFLQYLGTAPFIVHRMFIRFVQPFVLSGIVLLWRLIIANTLSLAVSIAVICGALAFLLYKLYNGSYSEHASVAHRVMAEYENADNDKKTSGGKFSDINAAAAEQDLHKPSPIPSPFPSTGELQRAGQQQCAGAGAGAGASGGGVTMHEEVEIAVVDRISFEGDSNNGGGGGSIVHADEEGSQLCSVCMEAPKSILLAPCGHLELCQKCCKGIRAADNLVRWTICMALTP